jgi:hypothetical protein
MLLGVLFLVSALTKLIDIDKFELYVYSFDILSLGLSYIAARLVIGFELLLGIALLANIYNKYIIRVTLLTLVAFTLFLVYVVLIGRTDNCHCFGEFVAFDPVESIIKNIVFIISTLFCYNVREYKFRPRWFILLPVVLLPFTTVFIISPPDNMVNYPTATKYSIDEKLFTEYTQPDGPLDTLGITEGKKLVAFYSPNCKYCKLSARKMGTMQHRMNIDTSSIITVFGGETTNLDKFYEETNTEPMQSIFMEADKFLPLTRGRFPAVVLLNNGAIIHAFQYRSIDEEIIKDFFDR